MGAVATLAELIDLDRYPIDRPDSPAYVAAVEAARADLGRDGCAVVKDLLPASAVARLGEEVRVRKHLTHFSTQNINPYFHTSFNDAYPQRHPMNTFTERSSGFIPGDAWEPGCASDVLFRSADLARFVADCLGEPTLYCYADPLAGLTTNVLDPGQQFAWHFDTNDFTVTLVVDEADEGGLFEYVPNMRTGDSESFDAVQQVLEGGREGVRTLDLRAGDMQIFRGRFSLHRVTRVSSGSRSRHTTILAYTQEPGVIGRLERTRQLFGRVLPEHEAAEHALVRGDALID